ncbi:hypothetical protein [Pseudoalteromonas lipolytica]|uniref:hypothetical protein n=1 Tax=Pseudoalteromonas TaxID=53246 RepID=UPI00044A453F|nr:hypothetical protein [Pseudoalteromonas lipolytica]EWH04292.1 hypothetical protein AT00_21045 [Pseudoalteromonas lipolytica SCSIO 04301]
MDLINYIESLSPFVQGVLGSAFLGAILKVGQVISMCSQKVGKDKGIANSFALIASSSENDTVKTRAYLICLYGATHYFLKALIFIVLSFLIAPLNQITSNVGYVIALYFLFRALSYAPHFSSFGKTIENRKDKLEQLTKLYGKEPPSNDGQ